MEELWEEWLPRLLVLHTMVVTQGGGDTGGGDTGVGDTDGGDTGWWWHKMVALALRFVTFSYFTRSSTIASKILENPALLQQDGSFKVI